MTHGLVLGKFLPPHAGHVHLIRQARARALRLTVVVGTIRREPIDGRLRAGWLREIFADDAGMEVVHLTEELPQEPCEHPEFWTHWRGALLRLCKPDVVFSSEAYGERLAAELGARHEAIDPQRSAVPISGTRVRREPIKHWEYIPAPVRPCLLKRVVVNGPESTGKSTLTEKLAKHFSCAWVPEFARDYLDPLIRARGTGEICRLEDIEPIARGHLAAEDAAARKAEKLLLIDTDLLTTRIFSQAYFGRCADWILREGAARRYDLQLLCDIDVPWVNDGQRDQGHRRAWFRDQYHAGLREHRRRVVHVRGSWDERFARAVAAIEQVLAEPLPHWVTR